MSNLIMTRTFKHKGKLANLTLAFVGDGENIVTHSPALASGLLDAHFSVTSPKGYAMLPQISQTATKLAKASGWFTCTNHRPIRCL